MKKFFYKAVVNVIWLFSLINIILYIGLNIIDIQLDWWVHWLALLDTIIVLVYADEI